MRTVVVGLFVLGLLSGCASEQDTWWKLEAEGFRDIEFTGADWLSGRCAGEFFRTTFVATHADGRRVSGVVCRGLITKQVTIRY